eukprot:TRINITY_DN5397_c0_g4_i1.p1 TRINITY_DN5397_c0_g4~~TRINITY_DN5397_c0_g4_i1.p1  ORF type:complete len:1912 (+),score=496.69 TRINITY_DN5397_c0_g4_i1:159-5738(+)
MGKPRRKGGKGDGGGYGDDAGGSQWVVAGNGGKGKATAEGGGNDRDFAPTSEAAGKGKKGKGKAGKSSGKGSYGGKAGAKGGGKAGGKADAGDASAASAALLSLLSGEVQRLLGREPTKEDLYYETSEEAEPPRKGKRGGSAFQSTVHVRVSSEGTPDSYEGQTQRRRDAAEASAARAALVALGVSLPEEADASARAGADGAGAGAAGARRVDPTKARELLATWLAKKRKISKKEAEAQDAFSESLMQQRGRGGGGPMYTCSLMIPSLDLGPFGGRTANARRKVAVQAAYAEAIEELRIPVPPKYALSLKAIQKMEAMQKAAEEKLALAQDRKRELQERKAAQKAAALAEKQRLAEERPRKVFEERIKPQILAALSGDEPPLQIPALVHVGKGGSDRAEQRASSDLVNICSNESALFEGPPTFIERTETLPGSGSANFAIAIVKIKAAGGGGRWAPVLGCAFGAKRGAAKSAASRICLKCVQAKVPLPVSAELAEERGAEEACPAEDWSQLVLAVSEIRKLEARGAGGIRVVVVQTSEAPDASDAMSGPYRCFLAGRVPLDGGLRDFYGASPKGRSSRRLAVATACLNATSRLSQLFGGGTVTTWLRKMAVTPMELEDIPRDSIYNIQRLEYDAWSQEKELKKKLASWARTRAGRGYQIPVPDLSQGPAQTVPDVYEPTRTDDPKEAAKRARGVPVLPVRSLRGPLAKLQCSESTLVVSGGTGSGKTTQLPQYIIDDWKGTDKSMRPRVVCTQPRRIAAISIAERVAWERGEQLGDTVGYTVRNDARPPRSRDKPTLEYVTVGILLRRLMDPRDPNLKRYTHVLVDEVHERDLMTDFLLILLKELLVRRGDIRVVLMSATLDVGTFTSYLWECSVLEVPSGPRYPVEEVYLDDLLHDPAFEAIQQQQAAQRHQQALAAAAAASTTRFNADAAEFVPGGAAWGDAAAAAAAASGEGGEGEEAKEEAAPADGESKEADAEGENAEAEENEEEEEDEDEAGAEDDEAEADAEADGDEDEADDADEGQDDEDAEDNDDNGGGQEDHYEAPRRQEYVSRDINELAQLLLRKEENSRRNFEMEQKEVEAERTGENRGLVTGQGDDDNGDDGGEEELIEAFRGSSTGVWWGSSEDGEALMDLCARLLLHLVFRAECEQGGIFDDQGKPGSILCFLPGWAEIKSVMERLQQSPRSEALWVLPLHSTLAKEDQQKIFQRPPTGRTKIILSTNIAESSVTIDDVLVVVDAGLMRELSYDPVRRLATLETVWVSQSSSIQRKGRAGRVRNGRCYRLFSRAQFEATPWRTAPEMQRCELSATCLQALAMQREVRDFLSRAPDPPSRSAVEAALKELVQLGAVSPGRRKQQRSEQNGEGVVMLREQMLPLGVTLSRMPLSPCLGRMLVLGLLFQCVDTACLLAAVISASRRPFVCPPEKRKESLAYQRGFDPASDLLACYAAAEKFEQKLEAQAHSVEESADRFALERFLVPQRLRQLLRARDSLREELIRAGLVEKSAAQKRYRQRSSSEEGAGANGEEEREDAEVGGNWGKWDENVEQTGEGSWGRQGGHRWGVDEASCWRDPAWVALHAREGDPELLKALLVASYPVNLAMRRRPFLAKHRTPTGLEAIIAPQSVNAQPRAGKGASKGAEVDRRGGPSWWAYGSMQISNKQGFLRTTTLVDPYHIVLCGGLAVERKPDEWAEWYGEEDKDTEDQDDFQIEDGNSGGAVAVIDDWIELQGSDESVRLLSYLRDEIRRCVHRKVLDPNSTLPDTSQWLLDEAVNVLRGAGRRQRRMLGLLPQQLTLPAGSGYNGGGGDYRRDGPGYGGGSFKGGKGKGGKGGKGGDKGGKGKGGNGGKSDSRKGWLDIQVQ